MAFSELVIVHCSTRNSAQVQFCTFLMCSIYNLYGSGWFFRRICSMWGCFWVQDVWLIGIFFFSKGKNVFEFQKRERVFFLCSPFSPHSAKKTLFIRNFAKKTLFPAISRKIPDFFFDESAKKSCFVLTFRPMQFQVHSMFFLYITF